MPILRTFPNELPRDDNYLADYRATVDRLREETAAELGGQPMPPETLSMIALAVASLPLMALLLPTIPVNIATWQVALVELVVWAAAFRFQCGRYDRFQALWNRKVLAHAATPVDSLRFLSTR